MKRLYLTVEGQTEQEFAIEVLQPHLAQFNVFVVKPRLTGFCARRKEQIPRGGLRNSFLHALGDINRWLLEDKSEEARFSTMVDLYSLPSDFPGCSDALDTADIYTRVRRLEKALSEHLNDTRFIPYVQVHEFEALILSKPDVFANCFENRQKFVDALMEECQQFDSPEAISDGQDTHPKARIKKHFKDYHENVHGPMLAADIGLETIRSRCPHFNDWLSVLENLDHA